RFSRDWSSDVCSSDLVVGMVFFGVQAVALGQVALRGRGLFAGLGDGFAGAFKNLLPLLVLTLGYIVGLVLLGILAVLLVMLVGEIGRAACRERVWSGG